MKDHDKNLLAVLERCHAQDLVINAQKLRLPVTEVPFIDHIASVQGLGTVPAKTKAVADMPTTVDREGVRRFLGMVQYLSKFFPQLADTARPVQELTNTDVD